MQKLTKCLGILTALALAIATTSTLTAASELVGEVADQNHNFVSGVQVVATDPQGNKAGDGQTDLHGRYCITLANPGSYTLSVDPGRGLQGGSTTTTVGPEGLVADWALSQTAPAKSSTKPGNVSPATASCGGAYFGAAAWAAGGTLAVATGAALGACAGAGCFSGSGAGGAMSGSH